MADISFIYQEIHNQQPSLETSDSRFHELATSAAQMQFEHVASICESFFNDNIYDIRIISYYLRSYFYDQGLNSICEIFEAISHLIEEKWSQLGPQENLQKYFFVSLCDLFSQIYRTLKIAENKTANELWINWQENIQLGNLTKISQSSALLRTSVQKRITVKNVTIVYEWITKIEKWLIQFIWSSEKKDTEPKIPIQEQETIATKVEHEQVNENTQYNIFSSISHPLQLLIEKLKGFEVLIEKQEMFRAAIVARDIAQTLETFDPKYFPQLFSNYFKLLNAHHEEIENFWQQADSFRWKTLEQLYHLELDSFVNLPK